MADAIALPLALLALTATLAIALVRPRHASEAAAALAGAVVLLAVGAISLSRAEASLRSLGPTVGFLAALLLIAEGCRREGLFRAIGNLIARRSGRDPRRLLAFVFVVASAVTIVLGLDATVVLLPPIVLATTARLSTDPKRPLYACAHLANSASLLLPVSNLTNLLAFRASGLSFAHFAVLMALPTIGAVAVEWLVISRWPPDAASQDGEGLRADARGVGVEAGARVGAPAGTSAETERPLPRFAVAVLGLTLVGFALSSPLGVAPVWVAVAGALAINLPVLWAGAGPGVETVTGLVRAAEPGFLIFVFGLGVIVATAGEHGLTSAVRDVLPSGATLADLILVAGISAVLANLVNNLPATLILIPVAAGFGTGPVLAVLVGVNVGPNLAQVGSLATLLWRRVLRAEGVGYEAGEFVRLGLVTVPPALVAAAGLLWLSLQVF
ncbi:MAG: SLC13 family permease [Solirubrobacteraceae bacterium]